MAQYSHFWKSDSNLSDDEQYLKNEFLRISREGIVCDYIDEYYINGMIITMTREQVNELSLKLIPKEIHETIFEYENTDTYDFIDVVFLSNEDCMELYVYDYNLNR